MKDDKQQFHFYASSCVNWTTNKDLLKCLTQQRRRDKDKSQGYTTKGCSVFKVPLPPNAKYKINNYVPVVEGLELIAHITY